MMTKITACWKSMLSICICSKILAHDHALLSSNAFPLVRSKTVRTPYQELVSLWSSLPTDILSRPERERTSESSAGLPFSRSEAAVAGVTLGAALPSDVVLHFLWMLHPPCHPTHPAAKN